MNNSLKKISKDTKVNRSAFLKRGVGMPQKKEPLKGWLHCELFFEFGAILD